MNPLKGMQRETAMNDRYNPDAACVTRARILLVKAAKGVEQLENEASQAFFRLTALVKLLARLEELARSHDPEDVDAALLDAATVCREAEILLHHLDSRKVGSLRLAARGRDQARPRAPLHGGPSSKLSAVSGQLEQVNGALTHPPSDLPENGLYPPPG